MAVCAIVILVSAESIPVVGEKVDEDEVRDLLEDGLCGEIVGFGPGEEFWLEPLGGGFGTGEDLGEELRQGGQACGLCAEVRRPC